MHALLPAAGPAKPPPGPLRDAVVPRGGLEERIGDTRAGDGGTSRQTGDHRGW